MAFILPRPGYFVKQRFLKRFRKCKQALVRIRYLIIINNWMGRSARDIEKVLKVHNTTVYRVVGDRHRIQVHPRHPIQGHR